MKFDDQLLNIKSGPEYDVFEIMAASKKNGKVVLLEK
jgi:hypothetical protein